MQSAATHARVSSGCGSAFASGGGGTRPNISVVIAEGGKDASRTQHRRMPRSLASSYHSRRQRFPLFFCASVGAAASCKQFTAPQRSTVSRLLQSRHRFNKTVSVSNVSHVLHTALPPPSTASQHYDLRRRSHTLSLPEHVTYFVGL